jgi:hypothetical protein
MKRLILPFALIGAGLCSQAADAAPTECFAKPSAVFAAHPNATHASYLIRHRSERCWYADAFRSETKPQTQRIAAVAPKPAPQQAMTVPAAQPRTTVAVATLQSQTTAVTPAPQPRAAAMASATQPRTRSIMPAPKPVTVEVPSHNPRVSQIARGMNWISQVDESPTDFEGRFSVTGYSVSGYRVPK